MSADNHDDHDDDEDGGVDDDDGDADDENYAKAHVPTIQGTYTSFSWRPDMKASLADKMNSSDICKDAGYSELFRLTQRDVGRTL